tara:strand:- start:314 stop:943 length:630 start_codon:yes stop_codon:yes gene_type:complete
MKKLTPILENRAIDLYAHSAGIKHSEVAKELGITPKTLMKLRKNPDFWNRVYAEFCVHLEGELPSVVRAMVREALAGNVQAGKLVLEWGGKLNKTLNINVSSPFEKWLALEGKTMNDIADAEIVVDELPERTEYSREDVEEEFAELDKELIKKQIWLKRRQELYSWSKRAELVGIAPLPPKRPTKAQRLDWEESIVRAESEADNTQAEC